MSKHNNKKADIAIALQYDGKNAPRVTAKGEDEIARHIKQIAKEYDIPMYEDMLLAQVLAQIDLGDEIPKSLYLAIARVIAFAYLMADRICPVPQTTQENMSTSELLPVKKKKGPNGP